MYRVLLLVGVFTMQAFLALSQDHNHDNHDHGDHAHHASGHVEEEHHEASHEFDPTAVAFHHISDLNVYNIGPLELTSTMHALCTRRRLVCVYV